MDQLRQRNIELEQNISLDDKRRMTNSTVLNDKIIALMEQLEKERLEN